MPGYENLEQLRSAVAQAKDEARERYERTKQKVEMAYKVGMFDAAKAYEEELARLDKVFELFAQSLSDQGAADERMAAVRPPTWRDAVYGALQAGPKAGMHVSEIWDAIKLLGVRARGSKSAEDPLRMVDDALYRLAAEGKVHRVGRRTWSLMKPKPSPKIGDSGGKIQRR